MTLRPSLQSAMRPVGVCIFVTLCVSGCHDSLTDPTATLLTEETRAALRLEGDLPSLPDLAARERVEDEVAAALGQWVASWQRSADEGAALRGRAYEAAAPALVAALGPSGVAVTVEQVGAALDATAELDASRLPRVMAKGLERARAHHRSAREALEKGDREAALGGALRASDVFREVGPQGVARTLLGRAEAALDDVEDGSLAEVDLERTQRLVEGARQALDAEDWPRAIQRAFYACQLLGLEAG